MLVVLDSTMANPETEPLATPITLRHLLTHTAGLTYGIFGNSVTDQARAKCVLYSLCLWIWCIFLDLAFPFMCISCCEKGLGLITFKFGFVHWQMVNTVFNFYHALLSMLSVPIYSPSYILFFLNHVIMFTQWPLDWLCSMPRVVVLCGNDSWVVRAHSRDTPVLSTRHKVSL